MSNVLNFYMDDLGTRHPDHDPGKRARHNFDWFALGGVLIKDKDEPIAREMHLAFCRKWGLTDPIHSEVRSRTESFLWLEWRPARESFDEILYLVLDQGGPEVLQGLLDHLIETEAVHREDLEQAAERMAAVGLPQAAIVLEATGQARSRAVTEIEKHLADPVNARARLSSLYRRGEATLEQMEAHGVDEETLEFVA